MALTVPREHLRAVLEDLGAIDRQAEIALEGALGWLGWHEDADAAYLVISRRGLLDYLWYRLPVKCLIGVEEQLASAEALAATLERFGERGRQYAEICRSPQTTTLIRRWAQDPPGAHQQLNLLLDASGTRPADLPDFRWGSIMGLTEALAADAVGARLEQAIEDDAPAPDDDAAWHATRQRLTGELLDEPAGNGDPRATWRQAIEDERITRWAGHPDTPRHALCAPVAQLLMSATPSPRAAAPHQPGDRDDVLGWLLDLAADTGIPLTQTHALGRAIVRECVVRRPSWYPADWAPPHRETDVPMVCALADLLRTSKLLRRRKTTWHATRQARKWRAIRWRCGSRSSRAF